MKKVLSLVLAGSMILSSMSMAFAATTADAGLKDIAGNDYETAIEALVALDVVSGYEDQTFRPAKTITRAELAKLLVEALGYGDLVAGARANFSDTQNHWSNGYVAIANGTGLVIGYPNGTFLPDQTVTYDEAYTMIVRALGYTDASLKGTWPTNFKVKAIDLGLTDDVKMATPAADRGGVAQALYNALEANLVEVDAENAITKIVKEYDEDDKAVYEMLLDKIATYEDEFKVSPDKLDADDNDYAGNIVDLTPYMYQTLEVYMNDDDEVVYIKDTNSLAVTGTIDTAQTVYVGNTQVPVKDADGKITKVDFAEDVNLFYNGSEVEEFDMVDIKGMNIAPNASIEKITIVAEDADDDDKIDAAEITGVVVAQQSYADIIENVYKDGRTKIDGNSLPEEDSEVDLDNITVTGDASSLEEIEEDDVVSFYYSLEAADKDVVKLVVSRNTVEGEITRVDKANTAVYIDGTKYSVNKVTKDDGVYDAVDGITLTLENEGTFYLDAAGKVVSFDGTSGEADTYGIVVATGNGAVDSEGVIEDTYSIDDYPAIKIATMEDETVIYDVFVEIDDEDGTIDESAEDEDGEKIVVTSGSALELNVALAYGDIVKYSLNADGQISVLEVIAEDDIDDVDTDSANFELADGAVIFEDKDDDDDFAVVSESDLEDIINGYGVYNSNGELEVIVTEDVDAVAEETTIAVVKGANDINEAKNADGDDVQIAIVYMNGEKQEVTTDGDVEFDGAGIYELEFDGDVVVGITEVESDQVEIQDISTANNKIKVGGVWYVIADDATMVDVKSGTTTWEFIDINDLDEETEIMVITEDGEVTYIGGPAFVPVVPAP